MQNIYQKATKAIKPAAARKRGGEKRKCGKEMGSFREKERENGERGDEHTCCSIILTAVRLLVSPAICYHPSLSSRISPSLSLTLSPSSSLR